MTSLVTDVLVVTMKIRGLFAGERKNQKRGRVVLRKNTAVYHVVSKTAYHDFRFSDAHKKVFRGMLERQAEFCGVELLTFCILDNHFHLLVRIPYVETPLTDEELIRRYKVLYEGRPIPKSALSAEEVTEIFKSGGAAAKLLRKQLQARMMNLSVFVKELKQRFSIWYNRNFENVGTNWCEPFKSVLIEDVPHVLKLIAAYIDLNPVRAGICENPEEYAFSSIGEACAGNKYARKGLLSVYLSRNWESVRKKYLYLLSKDQPLRPEKSLGSDAVFDVLGAHLTQPIGLLLRQRLRIFSEGGIVGSSDFVRQVEAFLSKRFAWKKRFKPKPLHVDAEGSCQFHSLYLLPIPLTY